MSLWSWHGMNYSRPYLSTRQYITEICEIFPQVQLITQGIYQLPPKSLSQFSLHGAWAIILYVVRFTNVLTLLVSPFKARLIFLTAKTRSKKGLTWPSDIILHRRFWWTLPCCLTAPSHYRNRCWLIISKVEWQSLEGISQEIPQPSIIKLAWMLLFWTYIKS